jgi:hypothetical protein
MESRVSKLEDRVKCETESLRSIKSMIEVADKKIADAAVEKHKVNQSVHNSVGNLRSQCFSSYPSSQFRQN